MYICQIKRSVGNFFLKCTNKYFFVSRPSNQRVDNMGIKMSPKITWWYLMAMSSMRKQKFIDQLSCKISKIMRKKIKWPTGGHLSFYECDICHGLSLCDTLHFLFIFMVQLFCIFLRYVNITKLLKFKMFAPKSYSGHWLTWLNIFAKLKEDLMETFS